jgi:hypothetical protein
MTNNNIFKSCFFILLDMPSDDGQQMQKHVKAKLLLTHIKAVPQLRRFVSFQQQRPAFEPRSGHVGFVVDKVVSA